MLSSIQTIPNVLPVPMLLLPVGDSLPRTSVPLQPSVEEICTPTESCRAEAYPFPEGSVPWLIEVQELLSELVYRNEELHRVTVTKDEYERLSEMMEDLIWSVGQDEEDPLGTTMACVGDFLRRYADEHFPKLEDLYPELREEEDPVLEELLAKDIGNQKAIHIPTEEEIAIDAFCYIGNVMSAAGRGENAIAAYTTVLRLKPDNAAAYCNRGNVHYTMGNHESAMQDYNEAVRLKPERLEGYFNRAVTHFHLQNYDAAIRDYDEALARKPDYADAYLGRAHANFAMHQVDAAIRDYDEAARLEPNNGEARRYREIARTHSEKGDLQG